MIIFHNYKANKKRVFRYINDLDRAELIYCSSKEEEVALGKYKLHQADLTNLSRVARSQKSKFSCLRKKISTFVPLPPLYFALSLSFFCSIFNEDIEIEIVTVHGPFYISSKSQWV